MDPNPQNRNAQFRSIILILFFIMTVGFLFNTVMNYEPAGASSEISYDQLLGYLERGSIAELTISDNGQINGRFRENIASGGVLFNSHVSPELTDDLANKAMSSPNTPVVRIEPVSGNIFVMLLFSWAPILLIIGFFIFFMRRAQTGGNQAMSFGKSKAKILTAASEKRTFKDVAGADESKEELQEIVDFLREPQKFQKLGGHIPKGVLLMGPPGTGKTLLAKAVAGEANVPFYFMSGSDFVEMFVGVGASRVRDMFNQGKKNAPCILFIDEIDAVGRHRGAGLGGGHDEREQTLNALLVEMDGFESNEGVIIVAATNRPDVLDPALLRPGRFDRRVVINRPDIKGREGILKVHTTITHLVPLADDVNLNVIARGTSGFSGADLANLVNEAALNASRYDRKSVTMDDFEFAKDKVLMGSERRSLVISDQQKQVTAVHEAGHALLSVLLPHADPLHKVTIIPRGMALGLTQQLPEDDRHNWSKDQLLDRIAIMYGGRIAEELVMNESTTGASNDFKQATGLIRRMVSEWGMSEEMGPLNYADEQEVFLGKQFTETRDYSEKTAQEIDAEVKRIAKKQYERAAEMIKEKLNELNKIAEALIIRETLDGEQVKRLLDGQTLEEPA